MLAVHHSGCHVDLENPPSTVTPHSLIRSFHVHCRPSTVRNRILEFPPHHAMTHKSHKSTFFELRCALLSRFRDTCNESYTHSYTTATVTATVTAIATITATTPGMETETGSETACPAVRGRTATERRELRVSSVKCQMSSVKCQASIFRLRASRLARTP